MTTRLRRRVQQLLPRSVWDWLVRLHDKRHARLLQHRFEFSNPPSDPQPSPYPFPVAKGNALEELGGKYQPTKRLHNYLPHYWMHFRDIRHNVKNVLEIGVETGRSIRMWEEFFPNGTIHGIDIKPDCKQFEGGRRRIHVGDQSDRAFLVRVVAEADGPFDIVIDDGSHEVEHQLMTFSYLFPAMSEHGIYVIEDTGGCVGDPDLITVGTLKTLVESILYWPTGMHGGNWPRLSEFPSTATWADRNVIGIAFYRWIAFVMRGKNPQDNPYLERQGPVEPRS